MKINDNNLSEEELVRVYANNIRSRVMQLKASIQHHQSANKQHYWIITKGSISAHGSTPSEALTKFEEKLQR